MLSKSRCGDTGLATCCLAEVTFNLRETDILGQEWGLPVAEARRLLQVAILGLVVLVESPVRILGLGG